MFTATAQSQPRRSVEQSTARRHLGTDLSRRRLSPTDAAWQRLLQSNIMNRGRNCRMTAWFIISECHTNHRASSVLSYDHDQPLAQNVTFS